jgi:hypothetical protein
LADRQLADRQLADGGWPTGIGRRRLADGGWPTAVDRRQLADRRGAERWVVAQRERVFMVGHSGAHGAECAGDARDE